MAKMSPLEDGEGPKGLLLLITPESDVMGRMDAGSMSAIFPAIGSPAPAVRLWVLFAGSFWIHRHLPFSIGHGSCREDAGGGQPSGRW